MVGRYDARGGSIAPQQTTGNRESDVLGPGPDCGIAWIVALRRSSKDANDAQVERESANLERQFKMAEQCPEPVRFPPTIELYQARYMGYAIRFMDGSTVIAAAFPHYWRSSEDVD